VTRLLPLLLLALPSCVADGIGGGPSAADFVGQDIAVTPGLASCAARIGRPDLAVNPDAPMNQAEIEGLIVCAAARARP
jgi:hypothetical protein